jgi:signal transduction histidine kinase
MVVVLLVGLLAAQLLGLAIVLQDRGAALYQASGLQTAQSIAAIVDLLDTLPPSQREQVIDAFSSPTLRIALSPTSRPLPEGSNRNTDRTALVYAILRRVLGDDRVFEVTVTDTAPLLPLRVPFQGLGHRPAWHGTPFLRGAAFLVQVQLRDGPWVLFERRLPQELFALPQRLLLSLGILLVSVIVVSLLAVRWLTRPLGVLAQAADELGRNIHRAPLPETGPTEVRQAAHAFNRMQASLVRYIADRERMLSAVSHDLKTPITRLRLRTEALADEALKVKFQRDLDDMEAMILATLDFMRSAADKEVVQALDINALIASLQSDFEEMGQSVKVIGEARAPYRGKALALKRALANLLDNAAKYGEDIEIVIEDDAARLAITVRDRGPGIPADRLEQVFEPFYRLETSRSRDTGGVGLGLGIARNIARVHRGDLNLRNRPGGGLEAILTLPR